MKKKALIITSAVLGAAALTFTSLFIWKAVAPTNTQPAGTHKVTWVDENDNVLEVDYTMDGEMPEYNGEKPASYDTEIDEFGEKYRYAFNGWNHDLVPVTEDVTYKAVMKPHSLVTTIVLNTPEDDNSVYRYFSYVGELEKVDWGDGTIDKNVAHAYDTPTSQKVTIRIYGEITELHFAYDYTPFDGINSCEGIDSIYLSYSITSIPGASMEDINNYHHSMPLQKIFIPASVKFIDKEGIYLSQGGTILNIEFEEGMELDYIGKDAFYGPSDKEIGHKSFTFGKNMIIHNICYNAFDNYCPTYNFADGTRIDNIEGAAFGYGHDDTPVSVSFGNNCVLGDLNLRLDNSNLPPYMEHLTFGNSCYIHEFNAGISPAGNSNLKSVSFGDNCYIETFGSLGYFNSLISIQFGNNTFVENMSASYMFSNCTSLVSVIYPETIGSELGSYTFDGATEISYISLPKNIKHIPEYFVNGCQKLISITIPQSVEYIDARAFSETAIEEVIFEEGSHLKSIGLRAFYSLKSSSEFKIELPEGLESIQSEFLDSAQCSISEIKIPKSVKFIDASAFYDCSLDSIIFAEGSNLVSLGEYALQGTNIKTLVLPNKLEYVGYDLCYKCHSLEYVKLPASLKYLGYEAFYECTSLVTADLTALTDLPLTDADGNEYPSIFSACDQTKLTIYVSNQTVYEKLTSEEGKQAWGDFTVMIGEAPQPEM